jgi:phospholipase/carboxylesterase
MLPYEPERQPDLRGTDVLIDAGERDPYSSREQSERLAEILRAAGADVTAHREPGAGHGLTQNDLAQTARWVAGLLKRPKA